MDGLDAWKGRERLHHDRIAGFYEDTLNELLGVRHILESSFARRINQFMMVEKGSGILDFGCGPGNTAVPLASLGYRVVAMDISEQMVRQTLDRASQQGLRHWLWGVVGDGEHLPFRSQSFDLVYSVGVLHHLPRIGRALREMERLCKPGARLRIQEPSAEASRWIARLRRVRHYQKALTRRLRRRLPPTPSLGEVAATPQPVHEPQSVPEVATADERPLLAAEIHKALAFLGFNATTLFWTHLPGLFASSGPAKPLSRWMSEAANRLANWEGRGGIFCVLARKSRQPKSLQFRPSGGELVLPMTAEGWTLLFMAGFHHPEREEPSGTVFRWSQKAAEIMIPLPDGYRLECVTLVCAAWRPATVRLPRLEVRAQGEILFQGEVGAKREILLKPLPSLANHCPCLLHLLSDTFIPAREGYLGDGRELGVKVFEVRVRYRPFGGTS